MATLSGFPYREVQFTKSGAVHDEAEVTALLEMIEQETPTDLFVISHGWNNDMPSARGLYARFFASLSAVLAAGHVPGLDARRFAVLGVLWPSKKFADPALISSGAASAEAVGDAEVSAGLDHLEAAIDDPAAFAAFAALKDLIPSLDSDPDAQRTFVDTVRSQLPRDAADDEDASDRFFELPGDQVIERLSAPLPLFTPPVGPVDDGGVASVGGLGPPPTGEAASFLGGLLSGPKAAAYKVLNYSTYYLMKERAGVVGRDGLAPLLRRVRERRSDLKLHLIGHSFGGRLVTAAAAAAADPPPLKLETLTLLQAAFSHNGLAEDFDGDRDGFFRRVVSEQTVSGPIVITYTPNDKAVGELYPLAAMFVGDDAAGLATSRFGGIGRNGAQATPEAVSGSLLELGAGYQLAAGALHNLEASRFIADHGAVDGPEVAQAVLAAVRVT